MSGLVCEPSESSRSHNWFDNQLQVSTLSRRCQIPRVDKYAAVIAKAAAPCRENGYHKTTNPEGYINLGIAVNGVNHSIINNKFLNQKLDGGDDLYKYFSEHGTPRLQKATADFMTHFFHSSQPVLPQNVYFVTSAGSAIDFLAHCLADPGDVFLGVTPIYQGVIGGLKKRSLVDLWPIALNSQGDVPFALTLEKVEKAYDEAITANRLVKGMILLNPGNPIGDLYPPELVYDILRFCCRHKMHFISDEMYAMSVHNPEASFHSILEFPELPDPQRTHLIYGISKDLGLTRLRVGIIHTVNKALQENLKMMAQFQCAAFPIMEITASILEDREWCQSLFSSSREIMRHRYSLICEQLQAMNLVVHQTPAAIYAWVNFKYYCRPLTFEAEESLFARILSRCKLLIFPGSFFAASEPGWFRILFTQPEDILLEAMERLKVFLTSELDQESE